MASTLDVGEESPDSRTDGALLSLGCLSQMSEGFAKFDKTDNAKPVRATVTNRVAPDETTKLLSALNFAKKVKFRVAILPAATDELHRIWTCSLFRKDR